MQDRNWMGGTHKKLKNKIIYKNIAIAGIKHSYSGLCCAKPTMQHRFQTKTHLFCNLSLQYDIKTNKLSRPIKTGTTAWWPSKSDTFYAEKVVLPSILTARNPDCRYSALLRPQCCTREMKDINTRYITVCTLIRRGSYTCGVCINIVIGNKTSSWHWAS